MIFFIINIKNGNYTDRGAAIKLANALTDDSVLTLDGCTIEGCESSSRGAVFFGETKGKLVLKNTKIINNKATSLVGGIWVGSEAEIEIDADCVITGNTVTEKCGNGADCSTNVDIYVNANSAGSGKCTINGAKVGYVHVEAADNNAATLTLKSYSSMEDLPKVHGIEAGSAKATLVIEDVDSAINGTYKWDNSNLHDGYHWQKQG